MAYPDNLVPGTPSALYGAVAILQTVTYIRLRGSVYQTAIGAKSRAYIDVPFYDTSTTRDAVDASKLGRSPQNIVQVIDASAIVPALTSIGGDLAVASASPETTNLQDQISTMMEQDDNFTHTPPHQNVVAQTEVRYYDGPVVDSLPTGNLLASFPYIQWVGDGSTIPQIDGSAYPTINPADNNTDT